MQKLLSLNPAYLDVINNSNSHASHIDGGDETHFIIKISSEELKNKSRVEQHKVINKLLIEEFNSGLHALSIEIIK